MIVAIAIRIVNLQKISGLRINRIAIRIAIATRFLDVSDNIAIYRCVSCIQKPL